VMIKELSPPNAIRIRRVQEAKSLRRLGFRVPNLSPQVEHKKGRECKNKSLTLFLRLMQILAETLWSHRRFILVLGNDFSQFK
jgi:hypothetical protein